MTYSAIRLDISEGIATLTLNRPERKNALDLSIRAEIGDAVARVRSDKAVRSMILTGAGGDFCAGGDIRSMASTELSAEDGRQRMRGIHAWLRELIDLDRPVISAVDGAAGAALGLIKAAVNRSFESDLASVLELEAAAQGVAFSTEYHRSAVRRFLDKQPPLFRWPSAEASK